MTQRDAEMVAAISAFEDDDEDGPIVPVPPATKPSQVYSVRIPVDRIEELRRTAARRGTTPSALMREWIVDLLDEHEGRTARVFALPTAEPAFDPVRTSDRRIERVV